MNFCERKRGSKESLSKFFEKHNEALNFPFVTILDDSQPAGRPVKSFIESSERSKRRKVSDLKNMSSPNTRKALVLDELDKKTKGVKKMLEEIEISKPSNLLESVNSRSMTPNEGLK